VYFLRGRSIELPEHCGSLAATQAPLNDSESASPGVATAFTTPPVQKTPERFLQRLIRGEIDPINPVLPGCALHRFS